MKEEYELRAIEYMRGKPTGFVVSDMAGSVIVPKGVVIGDEEIEKARKGGVFHYLMLSAAASVVETGGDEARRRLKEFHDITEGHEADFVLNRKSPRDVKDFSGNVLVREGDIVTSDIVDVARKRGILQELVLAVGAPGYFENEEDEQGQDIAEEMGYTPYSH